MDRIVDISTDGLHLCKARGFMLVKQESNLSGRIAIDEINALIIHAHGITFSNSLLVELAKQGIITVICGSNHFPSALLTPLAGHYAQGGRMRAQWEASKVLQKNLWKQIVKAKIKAQAAVLDANTKPTAKLLLLANQVKSGDSDNKEAQAARIYWPLLFGKEFRRDRELPGINGLLNYGYTILRSCVARAIVASGLNVSIGINHCNKYNAFALADDLIEPFRPVVDACVMGLSKSGITEINKTSKLELAKLIALDFDLNGARSPLTTVINRLCLSLCNSFENKKPKLELPKSLLPLEFQALGKIDAKN